MKRAFFAASKDGWYAVFEATRGMKHRARYNRVVIDRIMYFTAAEEIVNKLNELVNSGDISHLIEELE